jgi:hypothetical protein
MTSPDQSQTKDSSPCCPDYLTTLCRSAQLVGLQRVEAVTVVIFAIDFLLRLGTVAAVPQWLIYWDGQRCHEEFPVRGRRGRQDDDDDDEEEEEEEEEKGEGEGEERRNDAWSILESMSR